MLLDQGRDGLDGFLSVGAGPGTRQGRLAGLASQLAKVLLKLGRAYRHPTDGGDGAFSDATATGGGEHGHAEGECD